MLFCHTDKGSISAMLVQISIIFNFPNFFIIRDYQFHKSSFKNQNNFPAAFKSEIKNGKSIIKNYFTPLYPCNNSPSSSQTCYSFLFRLFAGLLSGIGHKKHENPYQ